MSVQQAPDSESEYSIYATTPTKLKEENLSYTKQESCCSNTSSTHGSKKRYTSAFYYESNDDDDDEDNNDNNNDTVIKIRKKKLINIDRRHAGGGGSFLVNDFMCRDILLLVKDLLLPFKSSIKLENNASLEIGGSSSSSSISNVQELNKRFIKLHYIINETLWRFQLIKYDLFQLEYGRINSNLYEPNMNTLLNDKQESLCYELMKQRKRNMSSASSFVSSRQQQQQNRTHRVKTIGSIVNIENNNRRSFESQRSLSIILPTPKYKNSNQTIMKLLSSIETLSSLCLKESKLNEANQLIKMYASNKEACESFEFCQTVFKSVYTKTLDDLHELDLKINNNDTQIMANLIEDSLQSLDLVKLTHDLLSIEKDNHLMQSLFLCDIICTRNKFSLKLSNNLADYARTKLNSFNNIDNDDDLFVKFNTDIKSKLNLFIEGCKSICNHLTTNNNKYYLSEILSKFDGIYLNINESNYKTSIDTSIQKYENFNQLNTNLDACKLRFESEFSNQIEIYFSIMNSINEMIRINRNEDIISTFFYDPNELTKCVLNQTDEEMNTIEKIIYKTVNDNKQITNSNNKSSNYLLSFYEYCKTLYEYFKENSGLLSIKSFSLSSCFSILNSSPASLICKLLFEDSIKPHLIESLTQKLNLNLTAIILHNSCPRLKLTNSSRSSSSSSSDFNKKTISNNQIKLITDTHLNTATSSYNSESNIYSLNSFYTILNENELTYCSKKKPDQFLKDLLFKLLKYCKNFNSTHENEQQQQQELTTKFTNNNNKKIKNSHRLVDLTKAKLMYESAEFKSILNESQELKHLSLKCLKTDNEKLSFFINLYNLLCIHAHFYLASFINATATPTKNNNNNNNSSRSSNSEEDDNESTINEQDVLNDDLFMNKTEKLLFQQRMCYKVGQMGCVSLYDLKHLVLTRSFKKFNQPGCNIYTTQKRLNNNSNNSSNSNSSTVNNSPINRSIMSDNNINLIQVDSRYSQQETSEPLYKYSYFKLDLNSEPLWMQDYLPNEKVCDYRVLFALTSCSER
jgi:hypothetical protein